MEKPPYRVPSMREIAATPKNGLRVASTFSGCGGSCLGFEMAGYEIAWASEFIPAAAAVYRLNHPGVPLDVRDIRTVEEIPVEGEIDVLEGSPPCASFSTTGKGSLYWGESKRYSDTSQRVDDLFYEFVRLLGSLRPRVFVAENVRGLTIGKSIGHFKRIHRAMEEQGYRVEARVLNAAWLGVPQVRERVIFVGVRLDLDRAPVFPSPLPYCYTLADAIGSMTEEERGLTGVESFKGYAIEAEWRRLPRGKTSKKYLNLVRNAMTKPCSTITTISSAGAARPVHPDEPRGFSIPEVKRICGFPDDFDLGPQGDLALVKWHSQQHERLGRAVPPVMMRAIATRLLEVLT